MVLNKTRVRAALAVIGLAIAGVLAMVALGGCSSTQAQTASTGGAGRVSIANPSAQVDPTTLSAQVNGDTVSIPLSQVTSKYNTRFAIAGPDGQMSYMAYVWNGTVTVRADICPPCGSRSFKLTKGTLVCNSCGTVFDAVTGKGKSGYCIRYSKQPVTYQVSGDNIIMKMSDLVTAYRGTLNPS